MKARKRSVVCRSQLRGVNQHGRIYSAVIIRPHDSLSLIAFKFNINVLLNAGPCTWFGFLIVICHSWNWCHTTLLQFQVPNFLLKSGRHKVPFLLCQLYIILLMLISYLLTEFLPSNTYLQYLRMIPYFFLSL